MLISKNKLMLVDALNKQAVAEFAKYIQLDENKAVVVDQHSLIQIENKAPLPIDDMPQIPGMPEPCHPEKAMIAAKTAKQILQALPKNPRLSVLKHALFASDDTYMYFGATDLDASQVITQRRVEVDYPPYADKIPQTEPKATQHIPIDQLITSLKTMQKCGAKVCRIEIRDTEDPIVLKAQNAEDEEITSLIMPLIVED